MSLLAILIKMYQLNSEHKTCTYHKGQVHAGLEVIKTFRLRSPNPKLHEIPLGITYSPLTNKTSRICASVHMVHPRSPSGKDSSGLIFKEGCILFSLLGFLIVFFGLSISRGNQPFIGYVECKHYNYGWFNDTTTELLNKIILNEILTNVLFK